MIKLNPKVIRGSKWKNCWQKEEDGHLPPIRSFYDNDDDLWRSMEDLMMMHWKMLKT